jgi:hypothetical protein
VYDVLIDIPFKSIQRISKFDTHWLAVSPPKKVDFIVTANMYEAICKKALTRGPEVEILVTGSLSGISVV